MCTWVCMCVHEEAISHCTWSSLVGLDQLASQPQGPMVHTSPALGGIHCHTQLLCGCRSRAWKAFYQLSYLSRPQVFYLKESEVEQSTSSVLLVTVTHDPKQNIRFYLSLHRSWRSERTDLWTDQPWFTNPGLHFPFVV